MKDPAYRRTAAEMLLHPFVAECKPNALLAELVAKCQAIVAQRGYGSYEDENEDTFRKKEQVSLLQLSPSLLFSSLLLASPVASFFSPLTFIRVRLLYSSPSSIALFF
jgi:hypothetical protein